jgi:prepilin-type N-terminal cleavage/methylation domain-containing protein/prepilin-type processing-associated H-X9-DG protein
MIAQPFFVHPSQAPAMHRRRTANAFTLVELLVVVAIIALLLAVLMPALDRARHVSRITVCRGQLKQIGMAHINYSSDNRSWLVLGSSGTHQNNYWVSSGGVQTFMPLYRAGYMDQPAIWYCPSHPNLYNASWNPWPPQNGSTTRISYSSRTTFRLRAGGTKTSIQWTVGQMLDGIAPDAVRMTELMPQAIMADWINRPSIVENRHGDGVNVVYLDGSANYQSVRRFADALYAIAESPYDAMWNDEIDAIFSAMD